ncbi:ribosomal protein L7/L12 [Curvibacter phage P26059A]|nr:ribosomal protein L7/L12 [Curvibacter phage P26059A]
MNISNLSNETLTRLAALALESNPVAVASILLDAINEPKCEQGFTFDQVTERAAILFKICQQMRVGERVSAIKTLRQVSGLSLRESKDAVCMAVGVDTFDAENITPANKYWYHAIETYNRSLETIMSI